MDKYPHDETVKNVKDESKNTDKFLTVGILLDALAGQPRDKEVIIVGPSTDNSMIGKVFESENPKKFHFDTGGEILIGQDSIGIVRVV